MVIPSIDHSKGSLVILCFCREEQKALSEFNVPYRLTIFPASVGIGVLPTKNAFDQH
jgi:hypothetical protein